MTYLEKWRKDHPNDERPDSKIIDRHCVENGTLSREVCETMEDCAECWNQQVPDVCTYWKEDGRCTGTKNAERCSCGGDASKCDFYKPKSDEAKTIYAHIGPFGEEKPVEEKECPFCEGGIDDLSKLPRVSEYYNSETGEIEPVTAPRVLDSGARRQFESGAVRDICAGKGRCDLLPLDVVAAYIEDAPDEIDSVLFCIDNFKAHGQGHYLFGALCSFANKRGWDTPTMFLEVAKQFEDGAEKYGDNNWQKGIPVRCYIDSAVRHYLKFLRGDTDEPHDRAFCWNILCAIWTCKHKPELNDYAKEPLADALEEVKANIDELRRIVSNEEEK